MLENFRSFEPGPDPFGRTWQVHSCGSERNLDPPRRHGGREVRDFERRARGAQSDRAEQTHLASWPNSSAGR